MTEESEDYFEPGMTEGAWDVELIRDETKNNLGVFCKSGIFEPQVGDHMWGISRIFFIVGMTLGSLSTVLAWALTFCLPPTSTTWKILSIMSAFTAVLFRGFINESE